MFSRRSLRLFQYTKNDLNIIRSTNIARPFSSSPAIMVKAGDPIPAVDLVEDSPGNFVNLRKQLTGDGLIIGLPAAFSKDLLCLLLTISPMTEITARSILLQFSCSRLHQSPQAQRCWQGFRSLRQWSVCVSVETSYCLFFAGQLARPSAHPWSQSPFVIASLSKLNREIWCSVLFCNQLLKTWMTTS